MKIHFTAFFILTLFSSVIAVSQPNYPKDPTEAKTISTDVENFISAFNTLSTDSDTISVLNQLYFDKATVGMKEYIKIHNLTPESLLKAIQNHPDIYSEIENFYNNLPAFEADYIKELEAFKSVMQDAMFPPAYLIIGDYRGIAQASKLGQLVTIEKGINEPSKLLTLMIHELTHFQQAMSMGIKNYTDVYTKKDNMLDLVLREGGAEFITYKLVRKNEDQFTRLKKYETNEDQLWEKFLKDLKDQESGYWLSFTLEDTENGKDILLGYAVGYKIVEAYYDQSEDKTKALNEILNITDANVFFEKSNYSPKQ